MNATSRRIGSKRPAVGTVADKRSPDAKQRSDARALARLRDLAHQRGFTLVSPVWEGHDHVYLFRCARGHEFQRHVAVMKARKARKARCTACVREERAQRFFDALLRHGITCQEAGYLGATKKHRMMCRHGHAWSAIPRNVLAGKGCSTCRMMRPDGLAHLHRLAAARQGQCLSDTYQGMEAHYEWRCADGHGWRASGGSVHGGHWCPRCGLIQRGLARRRRDNLARLQAAAAAHGGECLSDACPLIAAKYHFRCKQGHEWWMSGQHIVAGKWCKRCAQDAQRGTVEKMQAVARSRGGRCLSDTYVNSVTKLRWQCHRGHVWDAKPQSVCYGKWCPQCRYLDRSRTARARERYSATAKDIRVTERLDEAIGTE